MWYHSGMDAVARKNILNLSAAERIALIGDIWDSLVESPEAIELTEMEKVELDRRLEAYRNDPAAGDAWPVVRRRIGKPQ